MLIRPRPIETHTVAAPDHPQRLTERRGRESPPCVRSLFLLCNNSTGLAGSFQGSRPHAVLCWPFAGVGGPLEEGSEGRERPEKDTEGRVPAHLPLPTR